MISKKKAITEQLTDAEQNLMREVIPAMRVSLAHSYMLTAMQLLTGTPRRHLLEQMIEEMGRRLGLQQPPVASVVANRPKIRRNITGRDMLELKKIADDWKDLYDGISDQVAMKVRAQETLYPKPIPMVDQVARTKRKDIVPDQMPTDPDWEPESITEDELIGDIAGDR